MTKGVHIGYDERSDRFLAVFSGPFGLHPLLDEKGEADNVNDIVNRNRALTSAERIEAARKHFERVEARLDGWFSP